MMSNPWVPWVPRSVQSKYVTPAVAANLACPTTGQAMVQCLQNIKDPLLFAQGTAYTLATTDITAALAKETGSSITLATVEPFLPTPDGLLDDQFFYLAGNGTIPNKVPILVGTLSGEGTAFVYPILTTQLPNNEVSLDTALSLIYPPDFVYKMDQSGYFDLDPTDSDSVRETVSNAVTYNLFTCPTQRIVDMGQQTGQFPQVYLYESHSGYPSTVSLPAKCAPEGTGVEVCHSDDITSVFGSLNFEQGVTVSEQYLEFVRYNADAFSAFVRDHSPNPSSGYLQARGRSYEYTLQVQGEHPWQAFTTPLLKTTEKTQILSSPDGITYGKVPHEDVCDFFVANGKLTYQSINNAM